MSLKLGRDATLLGVLVSFDIRVGERTQPNGAVLAGSEDAGKNHLSTGTLGWSDLVNRAEYKVESHSIGISGRYGSN